MDPDVSSNMKHARVLSLETEKAWAGMPGKTTTSGHASTDDYGKTEGQSRSGIGMHSLAMPCVCHVLTLSHLPSRKKHPKTLRIALCPWQLSARIATSASREDPKGSVRNTAPPICGHSCPTRRWERQQICCTCQRGHVWSRWQRCTRHVELSSAVRPESFRDVTFASGVCRRPQGTVNLITHCAVLT